MHRAICGLLLVLLGTHVGAQASVNPTAPILVTLDPSVDTSHCELRYQLSGVFGGFARAGLLRAGAHGFTVETTHDGSAADSAKAYLACVGYQVETLVFDVLPPVEARTVSLRLHPLRTLPLRGVIQGWATPPVQLQVEVGFLPHWMCGFFHMADCGFGAWPLASVPVATDGSFVVELPDFANDPVIVRWESRPAVGHTDLTFLIRERGTGNLLFDLRPAGSGPTARGLAVQRSYPDEQRFDLSPTR